MASTRVLQAVGGYADKARMARDADCCMSQFPSLTPEVASHTSNDGSTNKLFKLTGTVPITYMNARYNIPVDIWLPQGYPHKQPKAYVTPTATMAVKPRHRHVGADGICYFPYLHAWSVTSSLQGLIVVMQQAFSEDPPVYAAPTGAMVQPPPQPYAQAAQTAQAAQQAAAVQAATEAAAAAAAAAAKAEELRQQRAALEAEAAPLEAKVSGAAAAAADLAARKAKAVQDEGTRTRPLARSLSALLFVFLSFFLSFRGGCLFRPSQRRPSLLTTRLPSLLFFPFLAAALRVCLHAQTLRSPDS